MEDRRTPGRDSRWLVSREDVDTRLVDAMCHGTTIAETDEGLALAFFGGPNRSSEGRVGQALWFSRRDAQGWAAPRCLAPGANAMTMCWNPVLYRAPEGPLLLFYKEGPDCSGWRGLVTRSDDAGRTWSRAEPLPAGIWGPIRNRPVRLEDGGLLCPSSTELGQWQVHFEHTTDLGRAWTRTASVADPHGLQAIQPTLLVWPNGRIQALCRTRASTVAETLSNDGGLTWTPLESTALPNPNSAIDAIRLRDGRALLIYNASACVVPGVGGGPRTPLSVAVSGDGRAWKLVGHLEVDPGEFSYPCVLQTADGLVHVTYTARIRFRGLRHAVIDPEAISGGRCTGGGGVSNA